MAIKFYTDEHIHPGVAKGLQQRGIDVLISQQAGMLGIDDKIHLEFVTAQNRVLVTNDQDFLRLQFIMSHHGIVYAHQRTSICKMIEGLVEIVESMTEGEMENHVEYL